MEIVVNKVELIIGATSIPISPVRPFKVKQTMGTMPYVFVCCIAQRFKSALASATSGTSPHIFGLRFTTTDAGKLTEKQFTWDGWVLVSAIEDPTFSENVGPAANLGPVIALEFADIRHLMELGKINRAYEVFFSDGDILPGSRINPNPVLLGEFIENVIESELSDSSGYQFSFGGAKVDGSNDLSTELASPIPKNLGNALSGGWAGGTASDVLAPVLKYFGLDIFMGFDSKLYITNKQTQRPDIVALISKSMTGSGVATQDSKYSRPKFVDINFEKLEEVPAEHLDTFSPSRGFVLENYIMLPDRLTVNFPEEVLKRSDQTGEIPWVSTYIPAEALGNNTEHYVRKRFFKPVIVPPPAWGSGPQVDESLATRATRTWSERFKSGWRRIFRIFPTLDGAKNFANIRLGRLTKDGGVTNSGAVACDHYVFHGVLQAAHIGNVSQTRVSTNYPMNGERREKAVDFSANWIGDPENMTITILPSPRGSSIALQIGIGTLERDIRLIELVQAVRDSEGNLDGLTWVWDGVLQRPYNVRVLLNGAPTSPGNRFHSISREVFPGDNSDLRLNLTVANVTSNWAYSDSQMRLPSLVSTAPTQNLNQAEIVEIANRVEEEVRLSYSRERYGQVSMGGVNAAADGVEIGGECREFSIEVGYIKSFSIVSSYLVQPGVINVRVKRGDMDGEPLNVVLR
jgi:hypothetical protein